MRHKKRVKKLGKDTAHRRAMLSNMASSLIISEYIKTTIPKAKACKSLVDRLISLGKKGSLHTHRRLESILRDPLAVDKLESVLVNRYKDRIGGYVSMVRIGHRKGDNAPMAKLVLIGSEPFRKPKKVLTRRKKKQQKLSKKESTKKGRSVLDRVREIKGRAEKREKISISKQKAQIGKKAEGIKAKSRSGI